MNTGACHQRGRRSGCMREVLALCCCNSRRIMRPSLLWVRFFNIDMMTISSAIVNHNINNPTKLSLAQRQAHRLREKADRKDATKSRLCVPAVEIKAGQFSGWMARQTAQTNCDAVSPSTCAHSKAEHSLPTMRAESCRAICC